MKSNRTLWIQSIFCYKYDVCCNDNAFFHGCSETMKTYGIQSQRPIICVEILNNANYDECSMTYTLKLSKHTFCPSYFAKDAAKTRRNKRYDVNVKPYLHDVNIHVKNFRYLFDSKAHNIVIN